MLGFPDNYSAPGQIQKSSTTIMHARGHKRGAGTFEGGRIEWQTQRDVADPADEAQTGDDVVQNYPGEDRENDVTDFAEKHAKNYDDINPDEFIDSFGNTGECDEGGAHLALCATHLASAKESHSAGDIEASHKSLNACMYHLQHLHQALREATNE